MEFHEKLQELRKQRGLTQDALAEILFVSRTAISKWESGRGYPNLDSLQAIAKYFSVSVDDLLCCDVRLPLSEDDRRQVPTHPHDIPFACMDCSTILLVVLPFFGQRANGKAEAVSLLSLSQPSAWLRSIYFAVIIGMVFCGLLRFVLLYQSPTLWEQNKNRLSLACNAIGLFLFIVGLQPYAAAFLLAILAVKTVLLIKKQ